jgi:hypothetical protein
MEVKSQSRLDKQRTVTMIGLSLSDLINITHEPLLHDKPNNRLTVHLQVGVVNGYTVSRHRTTKSTLRTQVQCVFSGTSESCRTRNCHIGNLTFLVVLVIINWLQLTRVSVSTQLLGALSPYSRYRHQQLLGYVAL